MYDAFVFSVVVPVYNRGAYVLPTLLSVKQQEYVSWECIVVDDGSDDGDTLQRTVSELRDSRFRIVRMVNGGGGAARNRGVREATGDFVAFLDSDDLFLPSKLRTFSTLVRRGERIVYYSQALVDRGDGIGWRRPSRHLRSDESVPEFVFVENQYLQTSTLVVPRFLAVEIPWDETLPQGQDLDYVVRMWAGGAKFVGAAEPQTVWYDASEAGRTSRVADIARQNEWLRSMQGVLSRRAQAGYRATVQAYFVASSNPFRAAWLIMRGVLSGVPLRVAMRQLLRVYLPRKLYRRLVNAVVATGGEPIPYGRSRPETETSSFQGTIEP